MFVWARGRVWEIRKSERMKKGMGIVTGVRGKKLGELMITEMLMEIFPVSQ